MKVFELNTYSKIKTLCQLIRYSDGNRNYFTLFRGTKTDFICPSILTHLTHSSNELVQIEETIHQEFCLKYNQHLDEKDQVLKDWKLRIMGREHELRNRLMDWSFVFYNALDFATYTRPDRKIEQNNVYLWILSIELAYKKELNDLREIRFQDIKSSFVFNGIENYPAFHVRRQFIQGGFFFVQPDELINTKVNEQPFFNNRLIKIKIPADNIETIRKHLSKTEGIDLSKSLMVEECDIDSFCHSVNEKYCGDNK